ncbi:hypothetical protein PCANC_15362 [Puccinia coronata f. sp. avenae]|uniref:Dolichol phosphate-mannose biosynthesis regulatory protein n=1 Tax=Puccinia coronata f. sp. avenae TaxID=200324 RepID=A0A2N5SS21_9BASI|nr:hypothetical protein PCANC_15362 [Puccinia coronata f. sp. avenae]
MGNSDKQVGFVFFLFGSLGFIYYTISCCMILLFPTETNEGKIGSLSYFMPYNLLVRIPSVGLVLFASVVGTCISLIMITEAIKDQKKANKLS